MDHDQTQNQASAAKDRERRAYDDERVQRSGATMVFWVLLVLLICLGICVLVSVVLALIYGS